MAKLVACEGFAELTGKRAFKNLGERLRGDVAEFDVAGMIETAGGNAAVVEDGDMRAERMACSVGVWNTCAGGGLRGPLEAGILVQVESTGQVETLVPAAKVARLDVCAKSLVDAGEEKAVPGGGFASGRAARDALQKSMTFCR